MGGTGMRYRTIVADPPWEYPEGFVGFDRNPGKWSRRVERAIPYPTMSVEEIGRLPLPKLADKDCRLFLWTTQKYLQRSFGLIDGWGFRFKQLLVWHKDSGSPLGGSVTPNRAEFLLVANQGNPPVRARWRGGCVITAPSNGGGDVFGDREIKHSRKPEVFLDLVETVSLGPYLELFARRQRLGWDTWGNEALNHIHLDDNIAKAREQGAAGWAGPE